MRLSSIVSSIYSRWNINVEEHRTESVAFDVHARLTCISFSHTCHTLSQILLLADSSDSYERVKARGRHDRHSQVSLQQPSVGAGTRIFTSGDEEISLCSVPVLPLCTCRETPFLSCMPSQYFINYDPKQSLDADSSATWKEMYKSGMTCSDRIRTPGAHSGEVAFTVSCCRARSSRYRGGGRPAA